MFIRKKKFFQNLGLIRIMILSRGSIIIISRGLRGGPHFKSEQIKTLLTQTS